MKTIPLTNGESFIVDDEDFPVLARFTWRADEDGKPITQLTHDERYAHRPVTITRFLVKQRSKYRVVFMNGNTLDCRKENLENRKDGTIIHKACKQRRSGHGVPTSQYKGVYWSSVNRTWVAVVTKDKHRKVAFRGKVDDHSKETERAAAEKFNKLAKELYGEYAYQNVIA